MYSLSSVHDAETIAIWNALGFQSSPEVDEDELNELKDRFDSLDIEIFEEILDEAILDMAFEKLADDQYWSNDLQTDTNITRCRFCIAAIEDRDIKEQLAFVLQAWGFERSIEALEENS